MTIDEAIERLTDNLKWINPEASPKLMAASLLGIEALNRIKYLRSKTLRDIDIPLLTETEEVK